MKKKDFVFAFLLIAVFLILFLIIRRGEGGTYVSVSVDGKHQGNYVLSENEQIIPIGDKNILTIINGEAYMSHAECPDKLCVEMGRVSLSGEEIICMPNRVIVRVKGGEAHER